MNVDETFTYIYIHIYVCVNMILGKQVRGTNKLMTLNFSPEAIT